jgi:RNA polymerase sigma factor (sigma-70 family)
MDNELELLSRYASEGDESAFEEVARRYVNLVYSAALRQVCDRHLAEDITQTVFIRLAQKAGSLPEGVALAGWLHADTRFAALQVLRKERRRQAREALEMESEESKTEWNDLRPVIDEALDELPAEDRDAVLLRFFGDRSFAEVGSALRLGPDAARMRVNRALEKLKEVLERRGVTITGAALGAVLLANSVQAAPAGTMAKVISGVGDSGARVGGGASREFMMSKGKMAAVGSLVLVLLVGVAVSRRSSSLPVEVKTAGPARAVAAAAPVKANAKASTLASQRE